MSESELPTEVEDVYAQPTNYEAQADREAEAHEQTRRRVFDALFPEGDSNLVAHAHHELTTAGFFTPESDYGGMLGRAVMDLIRVFAHEGHSGFSAMQTISLFSTLAKFKILGELTDNPDEWNEYIDGHWQSKRQSSCFSEDAGRSYYDIDEVSGSHEKVYHLTKPVQS